MSNNLIVQRGMGEISLAPTLNDREKRVAIAAQSFRCIDLLNQKAPDVVVELTKALNRMQAVTGFRKAGEAEEAVQMTMIKEMVAVVKRYRWMRVEELKFILSEGMIGEYGEFFSLDARTLNGWIKTYHDKERCHAIKKQAEHEAKQQSLEEEARKKREAEQAQKANRQKFIAAYRMIAETEAEAIKSKSLGYHSIPKDIDDKNALFYAFQKNWHNTLAFDVSQLHEILEEEVKREKVRMSQTGDWVKAKDDALIMAAAKSNARSKLFRMRLAQMLNDGEDIEEFIRDNGI